MTELITGILIGIFLTIGGTAWALKHNEGTPVRKTVGEYLQELGSAIANEPRSKTDKI